MSQGRPSGEISLKATSTCAAKQYYIAKATATEGYFDVTGGVTTSDIPIGILQDNPAADVNGNIARSGTTKVVIGAAVTCGARAMSHTDGTAIDKTGAGYEIGTFLQSGTTAGQEVELAINIFYSAA